MISYTVWVRADGSSILISQMSDSHISNSIAMIERRNAVHRFPAYYRLLREREVRQIARTVGIILPVPLSVETSR